MNSPVLPCGFGEPFEKAKEEGTKRAPPATSGLLWAGALVPAFPRRPNQNHTPKTSPHLPTSALSCSPTHPTNNSSVCIQQASMQIRLKRRTGAGMVLMNWATVHLPALLPVCQRWAASITSRASPASFRSHRPSYENIMDSQTIMCFTVSYIFVLF